MQTSRISSSGEGIKKFGDDDWLIEFARYLCFVRNATCYASICCLDKTAAAAINWIVRSWPSYHLHMDRNVSSMLCDVRHSRPLKMTL